jgi:nucleotide-binding universal stress UspA family protein
MPANRLVGRTAQCQMPTTHPLHTRREWVLPGPRRFPHRFLNRVNVRRVSRGPQRRSADIEVVSRILYAFNRDDCAAAERGFKQACELVLDDRSELAIVAAICPSEFSVDFAAQDVLEAARNEILETLRPLARRVCVKGVETTFMIPLGDPAQQIVRAALDWRANLIAIPTRWKTTAILWPFKRSLVKYVLNHAHCPVLTLRDEK